MLELEDELLEELLLEEDELLLEEVELLLLEEDELLLLEEDELLLEDDLLELEVELLLDELPLEDDLLELEVLDEEVEPLELFELLDSPALPEELDGLLLELLALLDELLLDELVELLLAYAADALIIGAWQQMTSIAAMAHESSFFFWSFTRFSPKCLAFPENASSSAVPHGGAFPVTTRFLDTVDYDNARILQISLPT